MTAQGDPESYLAEYFATHAARDVGGIRTMVADPISLLRAWRAIDRLPEVTARIGRSAEAPVVRRGLRRPNNPVARAVVRGTTAVLQVPDDVTTYLAGATESKRSLRTKFHRAERRGFTVQTCVSREERAALIRVTDEYERQHPDDQYRNASPNNDYLIALDTWLVARDSTGRPLLLAVVAVDGEWAVLEYFKTLEHSDDALLARHWMSALLTGRLAELGVKYLADVLSPLGLPSGLRSFQRRLGYRLVRVRIDDRPEAPAQSPVPRAGRVTTRS